MLKTSAANSNLRTLTSVDPTLVETLVNETAHGEDVLIQRDGQTVLVAMSVDRYEALADEKRRHDWERILSIADKNVGLDPEQVFNRVTEDVEAVREQLYRDGPLG